MHIQCFCKPSYFIIFVLIVGIITDTSQGSTLSQSSNDTISRNKRQTECRPNDFRCDSGQCLDRLFLCNGAKDCSRDPNDISDETSEVCNGKVQCPVTAYTFRCAYGACIHSSYRCNGINDCVDGSDEVNCTDTAQRTGCFLPDHTQYGKFIMSDGKAYFKGTLAEKDTAIILVCAKSTVPKYFLCLNNEWSPPIEEAKCEKPNTCDSLRSTESEEVLCTLNGAPVSCHMPENGTIARSRCEPFYTYSGVRPIYECQNGKWDQTFTRCQPDCGRKVIDAQTLLIGAQDAKQNEYPWVVAIYNSTNDHICGGTIISRFYVISAAHCFTTSNGTRRSKHDYTVVAGKHFRDINVQEEFTQTRKIARLMVHEDYRGNLHKFRDDVALIMVNEKFKLTLGVTLVCIDWDNLLEDYDFQEGNIGVVAGWGYTSQTGSPSEKLKKLVVPFRSQKECAKHLPAEFRVEFYTSDKICAGYAANSTVCSGDSGSGLYFKSDGTKYFIRGIVSIAVRSDAGCSTNNYALYAKVSRFVDWLAAKTRRVL